MVDHGLSRGLILSKMLPLQAGLFDKVRLRGVWHGLIEIWECGKTAGPCGPAVLPFQKSAVPDGNHIFFRAFKRVFNGDMSSKNLSVLPFASASQVFLLYLRFTADRLRRQAVSPDAASLCSDLAIPKEFDRSGSLSSGQ